MSRIQNEKRYTSQGFTLSYVDSGNGTNLSSLVINPGNIIFEKRSNSNVLSLWKTGNEYVLKDKFVINFSNNESNFGRLCSVYVLPDHSKRYSSDNIYGIKTDLRYGIPEYDPKLFSEYNVGAFIGCVYIPGLYPEINSRIYFRNVNEILTQSNFDENSYDVWLRKLNEKTEEWKEQTLYLTKQIVRVDESLWLCIRTHPSSNSFLVDEATKYFWRPLSSVSDVEPGDNCCDDLFVDYIEEDYGRPYKVTYMKILQDNDIKIEAAVSSRRHE